MVTIDNIDLDSGIYTSAEIDISEKYLTIQCQYTGIDGDFEIIPLQSNETGESAVFDPIYDWKEKPVVFKVARGSAPSGSKTFNIAPELNALSCKIRVRPTGGRFGATEGIVKLIIMNADS
jgi:hypothetical protein